MEISSSRRWRSNDGSMKNVPVLIGALLLCVCPHCDMRKDD